MMGVKWLKKISCFKNSSVATGFSWVIQHLKKKGEEVKGFKKIPRFKNACVASGFS